MEPKREEPFLTLDEELLVIMLENMSFSEIMNWCNSHPRFKNLCTHSSLVTEILAKKGKEEIVASVSFFFEDTTYYFFGYNLFSDFFNVNDNVLLSKKDMEDMRIKLLDKSKFEVSTKAWNYTIDGPIITDKEGVSFSYNPEIIDLVGIRSERCPTISINSLIFQLILESVAQAAMKGVTSEEGEIFIFRDGNTRFKSRKRR